MERMSTKEIAEQLGTSPRVVLENVRKCLPGKVIENGKPTFYSPEEVTVLLDCLKSNSQTNSTDLYVKGKGSVTTDLTPALKIKKALELMQEGYEEEMERLRALNRQLVEEKAQLEPQAQAYVQFLDRSQSFCFRDASKYLGITQSELMAFLKSGYIYSARDGYRAYAEYADYFTLRPWSNGDKSGQQLLMSNKGLDFFRGRITSAIYQSKE